MNMKNTMIGFLAVLLIAQTAHAAGILWNTEYVAVEEGKKACTTYGVYNPFENDVQALFAVEGDVMDIADFKFEKTTVKARTYHDDALPVEVCFTVHEIYKEKCLLGPLLCEKKCDQQRITFAGDVVVTDAPLVTGGITGSKTVVSASAPLKVDVLCTPHAMDYRPLYIITIVVIIAVLAGLIFRKYRTPAVVRKQRKLEKLQSELDREKRKK